jgi:uncharacterized OB-fold protein
VSFAIARDDASAPFFDAAAEGTLLLRRCPTCGQWSAPHHARCADGSALEWAPAAGTATLVSWAVDPLPAVDEQLATPSGGTCLGLVELAEGPWMHVAIVGVDPAVLHEGDALAVRFVRPGGGEPAPAFAPA